MNKKTKKPAWMIIPPEHIAKVVVGLRKRHPGVRISVRKTYPPTHPKHGVQILVSKEESIIRVGKYGRTKPEGDFDLRKANSSKTCLGITRGQLCRECGEILAGLP